MPLWVYFGIVPSKVWQHLQRLTCCLCGIGVLPRFASFIIDTDFAVASSLFGVFSFALSCDFTRGRSRNFDLLLYSFSLSRDPRRVIDLARPILSRDLSGDLGLARIFFSLSLSPCIFGSLTTFSFTCSLCTSISVALSACRFFSPSFGIPPIAW